MTLKNILSGIFFTIFTYSFGVCAPYKSYMANSNLTLNKKRREVSTISTQFNKDSLENKFNSDEANLFLTHLKNLEIVAKTQHHQKLATFTSKKITQLQRLIEIN